MSYIKSLLVISMITSLGSAQGHLVDITSQENFAALMADNSKPTIIKFAAPWCSACQSIAEPFKQIAIDPLFKHVDFYIIDIDKMPELTKKYSIIGIPTFIFINDKKEIQRESGVKDPADFKSYFSKKISTLFSATK